MLKLKIEKVSPTKVLVERKSLLKLIRNARQVEAVDVSETELDLPLEGIMRLAEEGRSLDFLYDKREDIYTISDLKVRYR